MRTESLLLAEGDAVEFTDSDGGRRLGVLTYAPNPCFCTDYVGVSLKGDSRARHVMAAWVARLPHDGSCRCALAGPSRDCSVHGDGN